MASVLLSTYSIGDANLNAVMNSLDGTRRGYSAVTITESTTTTIPQIAAGSMIEVAGALYEFTSASTLAGSPGDGQCYIYMVPSAGSTTITPTLSTVAPTWSDAKQGWYGTGGSASYRYINWKLIKSGTSYTKSIMANPRVFGDGQTQSIYANLQMFDGIYVSTGTTAGSTSYTTVAYPAGFTRDNCIVLQTIVYSTYGTNPGWWPPQNFTYQESTCLTIYVAGGASTFQRNCPYKMVIAKIST